MHILYGINSEGHGHVMRSKEIIDSLKEENRIDVLIGGKPLNYLKEKKVKSLTKIPYFSFITKNGKIKYPQTIIKNIITFPLLIYSVIKLFIKYVKQKPALIISDFEPISAYLALLLNVPLITIDNQHIITDTKVRSIGRGISLLSYKIFVYFMTPFPKKRIILSFFYPEEKNNKVVLVPPIIRKIITKERPKIGNKIIVYLSLGDDNLLKTLESLKIECLVYGKINKKSTKYLEIKDFDEKGFAKDLASSKAIISNAGMTSLGEAIYLKKPILCIPLKGQAEQELNAYYIEKEGFGMNVEEINRDNLKLFINNLDKFRKNMKKKEFSNSNNLKEIKEIIYSIS